MYASAGGGTYLELKIAKLVHNLLQVSDVFNLFVFLKVNREDIEPDDLKDLLLAIWTSKSDVMHEEKTQNTVIHEKIQVGM